MDCIIYKDTPKNILFWNQLAKENSNLLQSTYYDEVQHFYQLNPVYFEVTSGTELVGGIKLYIWKSSKLGKVTESLSKACTQFGEIILKYNLTEDIKKNIINVLSERVLDFLYEESIVTFQSRGFYGNTALLLNYERLNCEKSTLFNVASINLIPPVEQLWESIHLKHKQSIKKAEKSNLEFCIEDNIDVFIGLMKETYKNNESTPPNFDFVKYEYEVLNRNNLVKLFFVKQNNQYLSGAFNTLYGKIANYDFGGNRKNPLGAGVWLHWNIMKHYKDNDISEYCLGQIAKNDMPKNVKFTQGISPFKRRFGVFERESFSKSFVLKQFNRKLWKAMLSVRKMY